jgi:hypothetical protein
MTKRIKFSINGLRGKLRSLWNDEEGTAVLEASAVFPVLLGAVVAMLLLAVIVYQQVMLYYAASVTGERAAFHWDNSYRNPVSGIVEPERRDGLYWRLGDDSMLEAAIGWVGDSPPVSYSLRNGNQGEEMTLPMRKMAAAGAWLPEQYAGELLYDRGPLLRTVIVRLRLPIASAGFGMLSGRRAQAKSSVVEPAEFIRSVDLARYYAAKFGDGGGSAVKRAQAVRILRKKQGTAGG